MSWHDNKIHGFFLQQENFESHITLDIDHITEWKCAEPPMFLVSPASLTFHNVTDLKLVINWGDSGYSKAVVGMYIHSISRTLVKTSMKFPKYYLWKIDLDDGESSISLGASGFSQVSRKKPVLVGQQFLTKEQRER